jgi:hypothetical protein
MPDDTLSIAEMADLRGATESWFMDTANIMRGTPATDAYGGEDPGAEALVQAGVKCSIESGAEHVQDRALLAIIGNTQAFTVTFPANTDVRVGDHIILTSRSNDRLRIQAVMAPESWEVERRTIATELE